MKIIRIDRYNGKEEQIDKESIVRLFTEEQYDYILTHTIRGACVCGKCCDAKKMLIKYLKKIRNN